MTIEAFTEFSHGTMHAPDIATSLLPHARHYLDAATVADLESIVDADANDVEAIESINYAIDALQDYAAPYCYIGAHEGDGSSLGCWPCFESANDDNDILHVEDGSDIPSDHIGFALIVNDHGNATLVECRGPDQSGEYCETIEIWACV